MFVKNYLDFPVVVSLDNGANEKKILFDCERRYTDTGNFISNGITEIAEEDFNKLVASNTIFKKFVGEGKIAKTNEPAIETVEDLKSENEELKAEVAKKQEVDKLLAEKEKEILSLKEKLEAKAKSKAK